MFTELVARVRRARYELTDEEARVLRSAQSDMWQRALTVGYAVGAISHGFIGATMPSKPTPAARFGSMGASVSLGALAAYAGARSLGRATLERVAAIENSALAAETRDVVRGLAPDDPAGKDPPTKPAPADHRAAAAGRRVGPARRLDGDAISKAPSDPRDESPPSPLPAAAPPVQSAGGHLISAAAARGPAASHATGAATRPRDDDDDDASVVASRDACDDTAVFWRSGRLGGERRSRSRARTARRRRRVPVDEPRVPGTRVARKRSPVPGGTSVSPRDGAGASRARRRARGRPRGPRNGGGGRGRVGARARAGLWGVRV